MSIIDKLREQSYFTDAEMVLSNYILDNLDDIAHMTIYQLSENSFCSVATISRFCKKLKLKNYNEFKINLVHERAQDAETHQVIEYNYPFNKGDSDEEIEEKMYSLSIQTIKEMHSSIDIKKVKRVAELLDKADTIDIYANWNSLISAQALHSKLIWMGKNSILETQQGYQSIKARVPVKNHVAVIISYFGTSDRNIKIAKDLRDNNIPYVTITGPQLNPLCIHAVEHLHVVPEEETSRKIAAFSSDLAMEYVINVLYSYIFALNYDANLRTRVDNQQ